MNIKFNVEGIKVNVPTQEATIEIGKLEYSIEGLNIMDSLAVAKAIPEIVRDVRIAMETSIEELQYRKTHEGITGNDTESWRKDAEAYSDAVQHEAEEHASKSYAGADNDGDKVTSIIGNNINPELRSECEPSEMESPESHS